MTPIQSLVDEITGICNCHESYSSRDRIDPQCCPHNCGLAIKAAIEQAVRERCSELEEEARDAASLRKKYADLCMARPEAEAIDAARYRWLRWNRLRTLLVTLKTTDTSDVGLDAAIDARIDSEKHPLPQERLPK